jgi:hypothetical protein
MLCWWRRRKERQQQVVRDADNLVAFGNGAYLAGRPSLELATRMTQVATPALAYRATGDSQAVDLREKVMADAELKDGPGLGVNVDSCWA